MGAAFQTSTRLPTPCRQGVINEGRGGGGGGDNVKTPTMSNPKPCMV
jgi:hypothetical protein